MRAFSFALMCLVAGSVAASGSLSATKAQVRHHAQLRPATAAPALRFAAAAAKVGSTPAASSMTTREGLGENLPYPGAEYLGMGYNIFYGNPDGSARSLADPGWRNNIVRVAWCQNDECLSRDMRHLRPMRSGSSPTAPMTPMGWARPEGLCERSKEAKTVETVSDYVSTLSVDASVSGGGSFAGMSASFSASGGMDAFEQESRDSTTTSFQVKSYCTLYSLGVPLEKFADTDAMLDPLTHTALAGLESPVSGGGDNFADGYSLSHAGLEGWTAFFEDFGTHYAHEVKLGGKYVIDIKIKDATLSSEEKMDVQASIQASMDGFTASGSAALNTAASTAAKESLESHNKEVLVSMLGGTPPSESEDMMSSEAFGQWSQSVLDKPMPVQYKLAPISDSNKYRRAFAIYTRATARDVPPPTRPRSAVRQSQSNLLFAGEKLYPGQQVDHYDGTHLVLTEHGALKLYRNSTQLWTSGSSCGSSKCPFDTFVVLAANCKLNLYKTGTLVWSSTNARSCRHSAYVEIRDSEMTTFDNLGLRAAIASAQHTDAHMHHMSS